MTAPEPLSVTSDVARAQHAAAQREHRSERPALPRLHLAFIVAGVMQQLRRGSKRVESRLSVKRPPSWSVRPGDGLVFKSGPAGAYGVVKRVDRYEVAPGAQLDVEDLSIRYSSLVDGDQFHLGFWRSKLGSRYGVFMWLEEVVPISIAPALLPTSRSAWIADWKPTPQARQALLEQLVEAHGASPSSLTGGSG